ncbi:hypothetical protein LSAT2_017718 [Lamellibrachia satsuma]|nr:hypothetical protein LSAT2_017718 [Lamellibrachia satsuma]
MRCTTTATTFARVYWYKGSESNVVYVHTTGRKDGTKLHDFSNRIVVGQLSDYSDWATVTVQAPASVEYPRIDNIPRTTAFDDTDFNMTCTVSGSGVVKLQWLKDGVSVVNSDFAVTTVQVTHGCQEQYIGVAGDKEREVFHL